MTQENKELLLQDLCARLPYKTKIQLTEYSDLTGEKLPSKIKTLDYCTLGKAQAYCKGFRKDEIKPYLFPLSSMTEEQKEEYGKCYDIDLANCAKNLCDRLNGKDTINGYPMYNHINWCNKNHFDYRGLIPMGLAIDATGLNIY